MNLQSVRGSTRGALLLICTIAVPLGAFASRGFLTLPFGNPGVVITEGWLYDDLTPHHGIDYAVGSPSTSFPVLAAASGAAVIVLDDASNSSGYGNFVLIKHDEVDASGVNYFTLYAHLQLLRWPASLTVKTIRQLTANIANNSYSDWVSVSRGQQVGLSGDTGLAYGIHLHCEADLGGYALAKTRPLRYLQYTGLLSISV